MADIVFSTLVDVDSDEVTILPDLAKSWTASEDATTYTFELDERAVWSDGSPVTVEDVFFTIAWPNWYPLALKQFGLEMYRNVVGGENGTGTAIEPGTIPRASRRSTITRSRSSSTSQTARSCGASPAPTTTSSRSPSSAT